MSSCLHVQLTNVVRNVNRSQCLYSFSFLTNYAISHTILEFSQNDWELQLSNQPIQIPFTHLNRGPYYISTLAEMFCRVHWLFKLWPNRLLVDVRLPDIVEEWHVPTAF